MIETRPACRGMLIALVAGLVAQRAGAADAWQLDAYRVQLLVVAPEAAEWTAARDAEFAASLASRLNAAVGGLWQLSIAKTPDAKIADFGFRIADWIVGGAASNPQSAIRSPQFPSNPQSLELPEGSGKQPPADKTIVVHVLAERGRFAVEAREWDAAGATWGPIVHREVARRDHLIAASADAAAAAFEPQGRIESMDGDLVQLTMRGAELPPRDPQFRLAGVGDVLRPRRRNADGGAPQSAVTDWTWLVVEQVTGGQATCRLYSRDRHPLEKLGPARELLWLRAAATARPTELELLSEDGDGATPLAGYEIWARDAGSPRAQRLGLSDEHGRLPVPPGSGALRLVEVRSNGQLVGRLPMVPGFRRQLTAQLPVDASWLAAAAAVETLEGQLLDLAARRAVLTARIRGRIGARAFDEAEQLLTELRAQTTWNQFAERSNNEQKRFFSRNQAVQTDIQAMFGDLSAAARRHLDPAAFDGLAAELQAAKAGPTK